MSASILGVYLGHDPAACLLQRGKVTTFIEEERLTRFKHGRPQSLGRLWPRFSGRHGYFPWAAVTYCLRAAKLRLDELDAIVLPAEWAGEGILEYLPLLERSRIILAASPTGRAHHYRHALSAFLASPFERAAALVVDDDGSVRDEAYEAESGYMFLDRTGCHELVFNNRYRSSRTVRHGLGWMYHAVSNILGFSEPDLEIVDAGKTMGLAPYGGPNAALAEPWVAADGHVLDFSGFERWLRESGHLARALGAPAAQPLSSEGDPLPGPSCDLAFKVQNELERGLVALAQHLRQQTRADALCLAGGVALNSVANQRIIEETSFSRVFIQPAASDAGQALGLAYYGHLALAARQRGEAFPRERARTASVPRDSAGWDVEPMDHAYGGRSWPAEGIAKLLEASGLPFQTLASPHEAAAWAAEQLERGNIIGWFQGKSEFGPRALGHRSILADPRGSAVKAAVNARVKFREMFRPFAPSVLAERAAEVFIIEGSSPFMLRVTPVRPEWRERVPAITHVDGTARVQTVDARACPIYHRLIEAFARRTGVPLVLNTSFNLKGMPIVESPWDALQCFLSTDMDALVLDRFIVPAPTASHLIFERNPGWTLTTERPLGDAKLLVLWACAPSGKRWSQQVTPAFAQIVEQLDGKQALAAVAGSQPSEVMGWIRRELQGLLRKRALNLRVGSLTIPMAVGLHEGAAWDGILELAEQAGLISAHLVDG